MRVIKGILGLVVGVASVIAAIVGTIQSTLNQPGTLADVASAVWSGLAQLCIFFAGGTL